MQQQGMEYMDCIGCFPSKLLDLCLWKEKISFFFPNQEVRVLFKVSCMIIFAWKRRSLHVLTQLRTAIGDQIVHICHTNLIIGFLPSKIFQKFIHSLSFVKKKVYSFFQLPKILGRTMYKFRQSEWVEYTYIYSSTHLNISTKRSNIDESQEANTKFSRKLYGAQI